MVPIIGTIKTHKHLIFNNKQKNNNEMPPLMPPHHLCKVGRSMKAVDI